MGRLTGYGCNEMARRKASKKELVVKRLEELDISQEELMQRTMVEELFLPPETEAAEMIEGDPSEVADEIIRIIKEKGVNI